MSLFDQVNEGIKEAMRSRNQIRLDTLRMLKSKVLAVDARGNLSDADILKLFKTYYGNLQEAVEQAALGGRNEIVERYQAEMGIIDEFLPAAPSEEETRRIVAEAIQIIRAKSKKDIGAVMKQVRAICPAVDGKIAKQVADQMLAESP